MNLLYWMHKKGLTRNKLAPQLGISMTTLCKYMAGKTQMPKRIAEKIEELTEGKVSRFEAMWPSLWSGKCPKCGNVINVDQNEET